MNELTTITIYCDIILQDFQEVAYDSQSFSKY